MADEHEEGCRAALRVWVRGCMEPPSELDRLKVLEELRARCFAIFGPADERAEAADKQAAAMAAKWNRGA
jgi:hypothetical protein